MIIDCHVHITEDGKWFNTAHLASVDRLLKQMDSAAIEKAVLLPIAPFISNDYISKIVAGHKDRFFGFASIDFWNFASKPRELASELERIKGLGLCGIKLHPRLQNFGLNDLKESDLPATFSDARLPLIICGWLQSSEVQISRLNPLIIDDIAKSHKDLKILLAHMGGYKFWDAFFCARSNKNVFLDCSYFLSFFKGTSLEQDFCASLGKIDQKVIYGSDFPEADLSESLRNFREKTQGSGADLNKIFSENFMQFLGGL